VKKEYIITIGISIILLLVVGIALMSRQQIGGEIVILHTESGVQQLNPWQTIAWKRYYLEWSGESTIITIQDYLGISRLNVYDGKRFSVYATSVPVTITWDGKTRQFTA